MNSCNQTDCSERIRTASEPPLYRKIRDGFSIFAHKRSYPSKNATNYDEYKIQSIYGCQCWILNLALNKRQDIFARTCYKIILCMKQSRDRLTSKSLFKSDGEIPTWQNSTWRNSTLCQWNYKDGGEKIYTEQNCRAQEEKASGPIFTAGTIIMMMK